MVVPVKKTTTTTCKQGPIRRRGVGVIDFSSNLNHATHVPFNRGGAPIGGWEGRYGGIGTSCRTVL